MALPHETRAWHTFEDTSDNVGADRRNAGSALRSAGVSGDAPPMRAAGGRANASALGRSAIPSAGCSEDFTATSDPPLGDCTENTSLGRSTEGSPWLDLDAGHVHSAALRASAHELEESSAAPSADHSMGPSGSMDATLRQGDVASFSAAPSAIQCVNIIAPACGERHATPSPSCAPYFSTDVGAAPVPSTVCISSANADCSVVHSTGQVLNHNLDRRAASPLPDLPRPLRSRAAFAPTIPLEGSNIVHADLGQRNSSQPAALQGSLPSHPSRSSPLHHAAPTSPPLTPPHPVNPNISMQNHTTVRSLPSPEEGIVVAPFTSTSMSSGNGSGAISSSSNLMAAARGGGRRSPSVPATRAIASSATTCGAPACGRGTCQPGVLGRWMGTASAAQAAVIRAGPVLDFLDACLRGISEIYFASNPITGAVILIATFGASWYIAVCLIIGVVAATATAHALGFDDSARRAGLLGYSGSLTAAGIAYFTFGDAATPFPQPWMLLPMLFMSALACVLTVAVSSVLAARLGIPPFTLPFHLALWAWLLACQQSPYFQLNGNILSPRLAATNTVLLPSALQSYDAAQLLRAVFTSVSQVVFVENPYTGAAILLGIAVFSWMSALAAFLGAAGGVLGALALGIHGSVIYQGLWGYSPCLVGIALGGMFFVPHGARWAALWLFAVLCSVVVHAALASVLTPLGMPTLTLPAAATCIMACSLATASRGLVAVQLAAVTRPEDHRRRYLLSRTVSKRLSGISGVLADVPSAYMRQEDVTRMETRLLPALLCSLTSVACTSNSAAARRARSHLEQLLHTGAGASFADYDGRTPLHVAACAGNVDVLTLLLAHGAEWTARDRFSNTPLWDAIGHYRANVVDILLRRGAHILHADTCSAVAISACAAAARNDVDGLRLLLAAGCPPSAADYDGRTPLHLACACGHVDVAALLLQHGASQHTVDRYGETPAAAALAGGHSAVVALLATPPQVSHSASLDAHGARTIRDPHVHLRHASVLSPGEAWEAAAGSTEQLLGVVLFCDAAANNDCARLQRMLDAARSARDVARLLAATDYDGRTALHTAAAEGASDAVALLIARGASLCAEDRWGASPLTAALLAHHEGVAAQLVSAADSPSVVPDVPHTSFADTLLTRRARLEQLVCDMAAAGDMAVALLYKYGAVQRGLADYDGRTPLHIACACGHSELALELARVGAPVMAVDRWGHTPEQDARAIGLVAVARALGVAVAAQEQPRLAQAASMPTAALMHAAEVVGVATVEKLGTARPPELA